jgi:hypothetical protein
MFRLYLAIVFINVALALEPYHHKREIKLDFEKLRQQPLTFPHTKQLLHAIQNGKKVFTVKESVSADDIDISAAGMDRSSFANVAKASSWTNYSLQDHGRDYYNLDSDLEIRELSSVTDLHVIHCNQHDWRANDILIGSKSGKWFDSAREHSALWASSVNMLQDLVILRRIVSISTHGSCHRVLTERMHPLELFHSVHTETTAEHPFQTTYFNPKIKENRKLFSSIVTPDSPLVACDDSSWGSFYPVSGGSNEDDYQFQLGLTKGCAEFSKDVPGSFNFNYDFKTGQAVSPTLGLFQGVACENCFVFLGAGVLAIVNYQGSTVTIELKIGGGAGFNASVAISSSASFSSSKTFDLLSSQQKFSSFPLYGGAIIII